MNIQRDYRYNDLAGLADDLEAVAGTSPYAGGASVSLPDEHLTEVANEIGCLRDLIASGSADSADLGMLSDFLDMQRDNIKYAVISTRHGISKYRPANRHDYARAIKASARARISKLQG